LCSPQIGAGRAQEFAGGVFEKEDFAANRRVLDVDIKHGKENGDALAGAAMNSGSTASPSTSTVPWAGETMRSGCWRTRIGVAEKKMVKMANNTQTSTSTVETVAMTAPTSVP